MQCSAGECRSSVYISVCTAQSPICRYEAMLSLSASGIIVSLKYCYTGPLHPVFCSNIRPTISTTRINVLSSTAMSGYSLRPVLCPSICRFPPPDGLTIAIFVKNLSTTSIDDMSSTVLTQHARLFRLWAPISTLLPTEKAQDTATLVTSPVACGIPW